MTNYVKRFVSIALCICMLAGMIFTGGGLEALADSMNIGTTDASEVMHKTNSKAELGTSSNPFIVLEIVPTLDQAQFGYFIPGCEPVNMDKIEVAYNIVGDLFGCFKDAYTVEQYYQYSLYEDIPADTLYYVALGGEITLNPNPYRSRSDLNYEDSGYGSWSIDKEDSNCRVKGYFEKVESGTGNFTLEQTWSYPYNAAPMGDNYHFVYRPGEGDYVWHTSDADEDSDPNKTWMERDDVFKCRRTKIEHNDTFIQQTFGTTSKTFRSEVVTMTPELLKDNMSLIDEADLIIVRTAQHTSATSQLWNYASEHEDATGTLEMGKMGTFAQHDLTNEETIAIMRRMGSSNPAALIMEVSTMRAAGTEANVSKLTYMALQFDPSIFCMKFLDQVESDSIEYSKLYYSGAKDENKKYYWDQETFRYENKNGEWVDLKDEMRYYSAVSSDYNIMNKILTYNGNGFDIQNMLSNSNIAQADGTYSRYTKEWLEWYDDDPSNPESHTLMDGVQFILQQPTSLQKLRILEIQPCDEFIYGSEDWEIYYQSLFPWYVPESSKKIWLDDPDLLQVDTMSIWEFIGSTGTYDYGTGEVLTCESSDDLISKYDLIIIGANQNETNGKNGYNDWTLGNYIYTSVGDRVATNSNKNWSTAESVLITSEARYSAIDITLKKLLELQDFTSAGKPIVVDDGLYNSWDLSLNSYKIDKNSKMYEFLRGKDSDDGIYVRNHMSTAKMKNDLLKSICKLEFVEGGYPVEYVGDETSDALVLVEKYNPSSTLNYKFRIIGGTNPSDDTKYTVYLNTDKNGDGVYGGSLKQLSEVENMKIATNDSDLQVDTSEAAITRDQNLNIKSSSGAVKNGELKANTWYTISYTLPSNQKGIIPWKLEVASVSNPKLRSSAIDYTAIKCSENDKVKINVLQMNLTQDMDDAAYTAYSTYFTNNVVDISRSVGKNKYDSSYSSDYAYTEHSKALSETLNPGQKSTVNNFEKYLEPVNEFDVNIQFMYNRDWKKLFNGSNEQENLENWKDFLTQYDMLIFGFQDVAMFTANKVFREGLEDYIEQGKSVIFSHDMVQSQITNKYERDRSDDYKIANQWLRTVTGQRSVTYELKDGVYTPVANSSEYCDNALQLVLRAYSDYSGYNSIVPGTLISDSSHNKYLSSLPKLDRTSELAGTDSKKYRGWYSYSSSVGEGLLETSFVKIANNGQITTYPYNIPDEIEVLQTHVQNYALNLEFIEDGDVNVWYNLTDNHDEDVIDNLITTGQTQIYNNNDLYSAKSGDSRNNFYIYNKGNITYTGLGHGKSRDSKNYAYMTFDEIKLFINTMISAYRQPEGAPYAIVENADAMPQSGSDALFYLDYDETDPSATLDGKIIYEDGNPFLKVQFNLEDDSVNPDISKEYFVYFVVDGEVKEYKLDGFTSVELEVKDVSSKTGKGYKVDKEYVGSDTMLTVYIPYEDIVSKNGQLSLNLCTYAKYFKNGKMVTTTHSKTNVTTMYLPLFNLN